MAKSFELFRARKQMMEDDDDEEFDLSEIYKKNGIKW